MNILVTGARGFVGKNLVAALRNIRDGKDHTHPELDIREIFEYDTDGSPEQLADYAKSADFVFHLAGVNRPKTAEEYLPGNTGSLEILLAALQNAGNRCPVMLASSAQASLVGRYAGSEYGKAKLACEKRLRAYAAETGAEALIYRFPNVFGKWCRPNYNSAVATFCHNIAHDLPVTVNDPATELELVYIDDLVAELLAALSGRAHRCDYDGLTPVPGGDFCYVSVTHRVALGKSSSCCNPFTSSRKRCCSRKFRRAALKEALFHLSFLSAAGKDGVPAQDECRCPRQLHRAAENPELRAVLREYHEARRHQGPALAPQQVGIFHRCGRARSDPRTEIRLGRGSGV